MSSNYLKYGPSQVSAGGGGAFAYGIVNGVLTAWYDVQRLKTQMDSLVGTAPVDYTQLEVPFNLTAGTGQAFYNTIAGLKSNLDTTCASLNTVDKIA